jgi:DNA-binding response OmpR family regulator
MARLISVSYDETLLRTRELMLKSAGHSVHSAVGFREAMEGCAYPAEMAIIGHSIPRKDKVEIIGCFRAANPKGIVIALTRAGEQRLKEVDAYINPGNPEELVRAIQWILDPKSDRRTWNVRSIR